MNWQDFIVLGAVVAASLYLGRQAYRLVTETITSGCHGCSKCPSSKTSDQNLVPLDFEHVAKRD